MGKSSKCELTKLNLLEKRELIAAYFMDQSPLDSMSPISEDDMMSEGVTNMLGSMTDLQVAEKYDTLVRVCPDYVKQYQEALLRYYEQTKLDVKDAVLKGTFP